MTICCPNGSVHLTIGTCLVLVLIFQSYVLNYYIDSRGGYSSNAYYWFLADFVTAALFVSSLVIAHRYMQHKEEDVPKVFRFSPKRVIRRYPHSQLGVLPLSYTSWLVYATVLVAKVVVIFHSEAPNTLVRTERWGPQLLKVAIASAGAIFMLLVEGHHDSEVSSARNAYVRLLCGTTAYEIMDSVQFVSLLIISESHVISSIFIERVILALSAVNFFLPTISLYKLSLSDCGLDKGSPFVVMMYKLLHLLFINLPYMSIRLYLWSALGGDISLFLMKNILGVITTVYSVYPELLQFRARGRCCGRTPEACTQQPDTSGLEMDDVAAVSLRDAAGRTSPQTLPRAPPDETDSPALWLQHSFC